MANLRFDPLDNDPEVRYLTWENRAGRQLLPSLFQSTYPETHEGSLYLDEAIKDREARLKAHMEKGVPLLRDPFGGFVLPDYEQPTLTPGATMKEMDEMLWLAQRDNVIRDLMAAPDIFEESKRNAFGDVKRYDVRGWINADQADRIREYMPAGEAIKIGRKLNELKATSMVMLDLEARKRDLQKSPNMYRTIYEGNAPMEDFAREIGLPDVKPGEFGFERKEPTPTLKRRVAEIDAFARQFIQDTKFVDNWKELREVMSKLGLNKKGVSLTAAGRLLAEPVSQYADVKDIATVAGVGPFKHMDSKGDSYLDSEVQDIGGMTVTKESLEAVARTAAENEARWERNREYNLAEAKLRETVKARPDLVLELNASLFK